MRPEIIDPNRLVNEIGELLRRAVDEAVEIDFVLSPTLDPCRIDPVQFESALLNLIVNARDAVAQKPGKIVIETKNVAFDALHRPPLAEIAYGHEIIEGESDIDLLFSDVVMPRGMNGDELAREAGRRRPGLKTLLTSGYPAAALRERPSLGDFRVLQKPYRVEELLRIIGERLHH